MHKVLLLGDIGEIELSILRAAAMLRGKYDIITSGPDGNIMVHDMRSPTGRLQGKRPEFWIIDEIRDPVGEYLVREIYDRLPVMVATEPVKVTGQRKGPPIALETKGDRRRNRRYRWS